jgi:hypothetical protein
MPGPVTLPAPLELVVGGAAVLVVGVLVVVLAVGLVVGVLVPDVEVDEGVVVVWLVEVLLPVLVL